MEAALALLGEVHGLVEAPSLHLFVDRVLHLFFYIVMAYIATAYILMAYKVMAYVIVAGVVLAYAVLAYVWCLSVLRTEQMPAVHRLLCHDATGSYMSSDYIGQNCIGQRHISHNYIGLSCIAHSYIGHNCIGHNYIGHDYL